MRTVYKYEVFLYGDTKLVMPIGATILSVGAQDKSIVLWAEADSSPSASTSARKFTIIGTGQPLPDGVRYIGTTQVPPFVWHVYEYID